VKALKLLPENFILEIVGKGSYKPKIVKLANDLGVVNRIKFYQDLSRKELIERYAKADVLVLLSKHEAYGIVVAEALASKTPCIVANTSALSEWIDGKNVFGMDYPIDIKELSMLIYDVVHSKALCSISKFLVSWDRVANDIANTYNHVLL
jgi:glycosyltransferase involved in cell wall biosynthesis